MGNNAFSHSTLTESFIVDRYLMGVAALSCSPPDVDAARFNLERAREMMDRLRHDCDEQGEDFPFEEQSALVQDHLMLLESHTQQHEQAGVYIEGATVAKSCPAEGEEDEEWSSCDSDEEREGGGHAMDQGEI